MKLLIRNLAFSPFVLSLWLSQATAQVPSLTIGHNFTSSTYGVDTSALPPDSNGAVGPAHFVELINGSYAAYYKSNGVSAGRIADMDFWSTAGVVFSPNDAITDPRMIYDWTSGRWFASMVDLDANASDPTLEANNFLFAVSETADPNGTWHGFRFRADPLTGYFADFPTLGVDSNAVYLSGDFFYGSSSPMGPGLVSFPKTNLLTIPPTITNRTWFGVMSYAQRGQVLQPAICFDGSVSGKILSITDIGNDSNPHSNLVTYAVQNAGGPGASLTASVFIPTASWEVPDNAELGAPLLTPTQPDGTSRLMANDARLSAKVYAVGGVLYAVHNTQLNNRLAIRWYRVRAADNTLLESGTLSDTNLDLFFPSIAANPYGTVVISFNGCGPSTTVSCFAVAGGTVNGVTTFGTPVLLQSGATSYHGDDEQLALLLGTGPVLSRWGDYSATSVDPADPNRFWTIQMFPSDAANDDVYSTQITELITTMESPVLAISHSGNNLTLSWPTAYTSYHVQSATNLLGTVSWSDLAQSVSTNGSLLVVQVPASPSRQFFRLKSP